MITIFEDEFVQRLIQLRLQKGVSAREMSLSIGQNAGYIQNIESGKNLPSMSAFLSICDYLNIEPKDFYDMKVSNPSKIDEIINDLKSLNDDRLTHIAAVIKDLKD